MTDSRHFQPEEDPFCSPEAAAKDCHAPAPARPQSQGSRDGTGPGPGGCGCRSEGKKLHTSQKGSATEKLKALLSLLRIIIAKSDLLDGAVDQQISKRSIKEVALIVPFFADKETEVSWNRRCSALRK